MLFPRLTEIPRLESPVLSPMLTMDILCCSSGDGMASSGESTAGDPTDSESEPRKWSTAENAAIEESGGLLIMALLKS